MSLVLEDKNIPHEVMFDEAGVLDFSPNGKDELTQVRVCKGCFCNGKVFVKHFDRRRKKEMKKLPDIVNDICISEFIL